MNVIPTLNHLQLREEVVQIEARENFAIRLAITEFPELKEKIEELLNQNFLPLKMQRVQFRDSSKWMPPEEDLLRLIFLTLIKNEQYPITKSGYMLFNASSLANGKTHDWLGLKAILVFGLLAGSTGLINYFNYITIFNSKVVANNGTNITYVNDVATKGVQIGLITGTSALIGFFNAMAGLWFTGRYPDASSIEANKEQDYISALKKEYKNLTIVLEKLYFSNRDLATAIANEINIETVKDIFQREAQKSNVIHLIGIDELESAIDYIKSARQLIPCKQSQQNRIFKLENDFGVDG